jgi:hypothetical protein
MRAAGFVGLLLAFLTALLASECIGANNAGADKDLLWIPAIGGLMAFLLEATT